LSLVGLRARAATLWALPSILVIIIIVDVTWLGFGRSIAATAAGVFCKLSRTSRDVT